MNESQDFNALVAETIARVQAELGANDAPAVEADLTAAEIAGMIDHTVLKPETELELNGRRNAIACPKSGGVWWDPQLQQFRIWYEAGWIHTICYATSRDGLDWNRPKLDIQPGTNRVLAPALTPDSWAVFPDYEANDPNQRWKIYVRPPGGNLPGLWGVQGG